jgi:radical SAM protein with 4Fe4S-binding SPASM domain
MEENLEDTENFIQLWTRKVDGAFVSMAHDWAGGVPSRFRGHFHSLEAKIPPCKLLWQEIMILHDGTVSSCCHDFEGTNILGNIMQQSLRTIWSGGTMRKIRGAHLDNRLDLYPTCDKCRIRTIWWV